MKKLMIASLVGMSLLLSGAALADCGKCQQGQQAQKSCCQSQAATKTGWFSSGSTACTGSSCSGQQANQQQCQSCKEKAQGQAPSGGSSETKEQSGGCCNQKK